MSMTHPTADVVRRIARAFFGFRLTRNLVFHYALMVTFYRSNGLSLIEIGWMETVYWTAKLLADIPSGMVADRYGQRHTLYAGNLVLITGFLGFAAATNFSAIAAAQVLVAIGHSLTSNSDSAACRRLLNDIGRADIYSRVESAAMAARNVGLFVSIAAASLVVGAFGLRPLFVASAIATLVSLLFIDAFSEGRGIGDTTPGASPIALLFKRPGDVLGGLWSLVFLYSVFFFVDFFSLNLFQITLTSRGFTSAQTSGAFSALVLASAAAGLILSKLNLSERRGIVIIGASALLHLLLLLIISAQSRTWDAGTVTLVYAPLAALKGAYIPVLRSMLLDAAPPGRASVTLGCAAVVAGITMVMGTPVLMALAGSAGVPAVAAVLFGLTSLGVTSFLVCGPRGREGQA